MGAEGPILCPGGGSHRSLPQNCRSDRDDDLADLVVRFEEAVRVLDGVEREGASDPRLERARFQSRHDERLGAIDRPPTEWSAWTNGQAERMVRTIKEVTVKSFHYTSINELRRHVRDWLVAYNFAKQLKALRFKTPYEAIEELWKSKPDIFNMKPHHHTLGLNT